MTRPQSTNGAERAGPPGWLELLGQASLFVGLVGAWLFLTGWGFAYWYFASFGIGLTALGIPKETFFLYGFWVFRDYAWESAVLVVAGAAGFWLWRRAAPISVARPFAVALIVLHFALEVFGNAGWWQPMMSTLLLTFVPWQWSAAILTTCLPRRAREVAQRSPA